MSGVMTTVTCSWGSEISTPTPCIIAPCIVIAHSLVVSCLVFLRMAFLVLVESIKYYFTKPCSELCDCILCELQEMLGVRC